MRAPDDNAHLDAWIADPAVRTRHQRSAGAAPGAVWSAATRVRLADTGRLGRLVRWRIPGLRDEMTYHELFRGYPFAVLDEGEDFLVSGLCGRIWTLARDYPRIDGPEAFKTWDEPATVRVVFAHWVRPEAEGAVLVSEARVEPTDRSAAVRLRALWAVIGPFERLVGAEAIAAAIDRSARA